MRREGARELLLIVPDRKPQGHANVSPFTFQLDQLDGLCVSEGLPEIRILIIIDQCAQFDGKLWDHKRGAILTKIGELKVRIGGWRRDMWHNFCNKVQDTRTAGLLLSALAQRVRIQRAGRETSVP